MSNELVMSRSENFVEFDKKREQVVSFMATKKHYLVPKSLFDWSSFFSNHQVFHDIIP